jgi:serine/threonine protein kinase
VDKTGYLKVCDFGFAVRLPLGHKTYTLCGTVEYLAPELLVGKGHNRGVDWQVLSIPPLFSRSLFLPRVLLLHALEDAAQVA